MFLPVSVFAQTRVAPEPQTPLKHDFTLNFELQKPSLKPGARAAELNMKRLQLGLFFAVFTVCLTAAAVSPPKEQDYGKIELLLLRLSSTICPVLSQV